MKGFVVPIILGSLSSIPTCLQGALYSLNIYYANLIPKLQKSVLLSSLHILCRLVTEH